MCPDRARMDLAHEDRGTSAAITATFNCWAGMIGCVATYDYKET